MSALPNIQPLTLAAAAAADWPEPDYILGPLQAGDVGIISGADGSGKSWVALAAAATVAYGESICGIFPAPERTGRVLYVAGEDRRADHGRRLAWLAGHMQQGHKMPVPEEDDRLIVWPLEGRRQPLVRLEQGEYLITEIGHEFAEAIRDYRLVIMDPMRMFHDLGEGDGPGMDTLVRWLVTVAMANQQAILVVHHASQGAILNSREDHHAGRGATDFPAGCRGAWTLRGMSAEEAKSAKISEDARCDWRCLINSKASHRAEGGRVWMQRQGGGLLVRSSYTPGEMADAAKSRRGGLAVVKGGGDDDF